MEYILLIEELAELDLDEAFVWYEFQRKGLGVEFIKSVNLSFDKIKTNPKFYKKVYFELRRFILLKFPYMIYYYIKEEYIVITAILHNKRNPAILQNRKK